MNKYRIRDLPKPKRLIQDHEIEDFAKRNPSKWKKMKKGFDIGRQILNVQCYNGTENENDVILRHFLYDYNRRFLRHGFNAMPTSFNLIEAFLSYNGRYSIIELIEEQESYGVSLIDFLETVTSTEFKSSINKINESIDEDLIYCFTFTSGAKEYSFKSETSKEFYIGHVSLIRRKNEITLLITSGEKYDRKEAEEYFNDKSRNSLNEGLSAKRKEQGFEIMHEGEPKVVHYLGDKSLWLHNIIVRIDIETNTIDARWVGRDENLNYFIETDDPSIYFDNDDNLSESDINDLRNNDIKLEKYEPIFEFAKYCIHLPEYSIINENKIVDVEYQTSLNQIISGPISKRKFKLVPGIHKLFSRPFYYVEAKQYVEHETTLKDSSICVERKGLWKKIKYDEYGQDKKGRKIKGRTWVERTDLYFKDKDTCIGVSQRNEFNGVDSGKVYIMRQPAFPKGMYKVGLTTKETINRKKQLSNTSVPEDYFVLQEFETYNCKQAEDEIFERLSIYRVSKRKEFFKCDFKVISEICKSVIEEINKEHPHNKR